MTGFQMVHSLGEETALEVEVAILQLKGGDSSKWQFGKKEYSALLNSQGDAHVSSLIFPPPL